jgi:hypothetical protein
LGYGDPNGNNGAHFFQAMLAALQTIDLWPGACKVVATGQRVLNKLLVLQSYSWNSQSLGQPWEWRVEKPTPSLCWIMSKKLAFSEDVSHGRQLQSGCSLALAQGPSNNKLCYQTSGYLHPRPTQSMEDLMTVSPHLKLPRNSQRPPTPYPDRARTQGEKLGKRSQTLAYSWGRFVCCLAISWESSGKFQRPV